MSYHSLNIEQVLDEFDTNFSGLSSEKAKERLNRYGKNVLPEEKKSLLGIFLKQFKNIFNLVLFFVLLLTLYLGKFTDSLVVLLIILVNAFIGFFFELRTEKTLEKLKELLKPKAKVLRDGELIEISAEEIVPGDIIYIEEGDIIPAELRFFEIENLKVDESILTGESLPVEKDIKVLPEETSIPEMKNIGFMGSYVVEGKGKGIVVATGTRTYVGTIYERFKRIEQFAPHFEKLSKDLILRMILIAISTSILIFYFTFQRHYLWSESLLFVSSSFASSIPEGLPVIITVLLVVSAYALHRKNILVKNLQATENLSVINLLLSDKTGTLTENVMTTRKIFVDDEEIEITGEGHSLEGKFLKNGKEINILENYPLVKLLNICAVISEGEIIRDHEIKLKGNPRDVALLVLVEKAGFKREEILSKEKMKKREPFSRIKKHKRVIVEHERIESYYVGAFEKIIEDCECILTHQGVEDFKNKDEILNKALEYANNGFSVLAVAYNEGEREENLIFVGLVALYDPPKKGVKETIAKLKSAGIDIRILTGDHKATAVYIAKEIGFENLNVVDEEELKNLSEDELKEKIKDIYIFARITPETKLKILELYQKLGYSVAYIGDGVNDVLGLKKAEVGVCMGKRGSEIAKSASDIILIDDNLESLLSGFMEGRKIFNNLKRVVFFLITTNVAESLTILTSLIFGYPFILKPTHILFLNFVTDTLVGTTLAFEKEHGHELQSKPRNPKESLISLDLIPFLLIMASIMMMLTVLIFTGEYLINLDKARTYAFLVMSLTQLYNALNLRSLNRSIFKLSFKLNPYIIFGILFSLLLQYFVLFSSPLRSILGFSEIGLFEFLLILVLSSVVLIIGEIYKFIKMRLKK
jgi:Ca2+-transporting ATPase